MTLASHNDEVIVLSSPMPQLLHTPDTLATPSLQPARLLFPYDLMTATYNDEYSNLEIDTTGPSEPHNTSSSNTSYKCTMDNSMDTYRTHMDSQSTSLSKSAAVNCRGNTSDYQIYREDSILSPPPKHPKGPNADGQDTGYIASSSPYTNTYSNHINEETARRRDLLLQHQQSFFISIFLPRMEEEEMVVRVTQHYRQYHYERELLVEGQFQLLESVMRKGIVRVHRQWLGALVMFLKAIPSEWDVIDTMCRGEMSEKVAILLIEYHRRCGRYLFHIDDECGIGSKGNYSVTFWSLMFSEAIKKEKKRRKSQKRKSVYKRFRSILETQGISPPTNATEKEKHAFYSFHFKRYYEALCASSDRDPVTGVRQPVFKVSAVVDRTTNNITPHFERMVLCKEYKRVLQETIDLQEEVQDNECLKVLLKVLRRSSRQQSPMRKSQVDRRNVGGSKRDTIQYGAASRRISVPSWCRPLFAASLSKDINSSYVMPPSIRSSLSRVIVPSRPTSPQSSSRISNRPHVQLTSRPTSARRINSSGMELNDDEVSKRLCDHIPGYSPSSEVSKTVNNNNILLPTFESLYDENIKSFSSLQQSECRKVGGPSSVSSTLYGSSRSATSHKWRISRPSSCIDTYNDLAGTNSANVGNRHQRNLLKAYINNTSLSSSSHLGNAHGIRVPSSTGNINTHDLLRSQSASYFTTHYTLRNRENGESDLEGDQQVSPRGRCIDGSVRDTYTVVSPRRRKMEELQWALESQRRESRAGRGIPKHTNVTPIKRDVHVADVEDEDNFAFILRCKGLSANQLFDYFTRLMESERCYQLDQRREKQYNAYRVHLDIMESTKACKAHFLEWANKEENRLGLVPSCLANYSVESDINNNIVMPTTINIDSEQFLYHAFYIYLLTGVASAGALNDTHPYRIALSEGRRHREIWEVITKSEQSIRQCQASGTPSNVYPYRQQKAIVVGGGNGTGTADLTSAELFLTNSESNKCSLQDGGNDSYLSDYSYAVLLASLRPAYHFYPIGSELWERKMKYLCR